jgi:hypothetical protein
MVVYFHRHPTTLKVFYVGIGTPKRPYQFYKSSRNNLWHKIVNKYGTPIVEIIHSNVSKEDACELEIKYIKFFGLINKGGCLCNMSYGGELSPMKNKEVAEKVHAQLRGKKRPDMSGEANPAKKQVNRNLSRESMIKLRANRTTQHIEKQKKSAIKLFTNHNPMANPLSKWKILEHQRKRVIQMDRSGNEILGHLSINDAGRFIGKPGSKVYMCCAGQRKTAYGYKWKYAS